MSALLILAAFVGQDDGAVVRCAITKTPPAELSTIRAAMLASVTASKAPNAATEAAVNRVRVRAAECSPGSGEGDARAGEIAVATLAVESLSTELQARGVSVLVLNDRLRRTAPATLDALLAKTRNAQTEALAKEMMAAAGGKARDDGVRRLIGGYTFNAARLGKLFKSTAR